MTEPEDREAFALEPLEAASALDSGRDLVFVEPTNDGQLIAAETDSELIAAYLNRSGLAATTVENTRKELERFVAWCWWQGLTLRAVRTEHLMAYSAFVMDPQPAAKWVSTTRWPRTSPHWRAFTGPLSASSHRQAMIAIRALFRWASDARYLDGNPAALLGKMKMPRQDRVTRYLPKDAISLAYTAIDASADATPSGLRRKARNRFLFAAYAMTGCRLSELLSANMGDIYVEDGQWWLTVEGKGEKPRRLPVPAELLAMFESYRVAFGLLPRTTRDDMTPMVMSSRGGSLRMTRTAVDLAMKEVLAGAAAMAADRGDENLALVLRNASTHWLRHSLLTHLANDGVPLEVVQAQAGHASLETTGLYLHTKDKIRHELVVAAVEKDKK
jgi:site-specific recombinase XerD